MDVAIYVVDAFTDQSFRGNAAAVCLLESSIGDSTLQAIATEMNQSETAFLQRAGDACYELRWFTPKQEVPLCGHATLASAHVLWTEQSSTDQLIFQTKSGKLSASLEGDRIVLDFPTGFLRPVAMSEVHQVATGGAARFFGESDHFWLAELDSEETVRNFQPDLDAIGRLGKGGLIVTARSESAADDFVSRLFAPNLGIPEDPVTGSSHCVLSAYWSPKLGKTEMVGYQASTRGGFVGVEFQGARTLLKGRCVTTLRGRLTA